MRTTSSLSEERWMAKLDEIKLFPVPPLPPPTAQIVFSVVSLLPDQK
jgi:hypothetical protein